MKKVVVIGSLESGTKNDPRVLSAHLRERGIAVETCFWEHLAFDIQTDNVRVTSLDKDIVADLQPDVVIALGWYKGGKKSFYRDVAYSAALYLESAGVTVWNSEITQQRSTSKLSCMMQLALQGIPVPRTLFSIDAKLLDLPPLPFVAKAMAASRGADNFLVKSAEQAAEFTEKRPNTFIVQPFLPNDHDLRVICFGGQPSLVLRRSRGSDSTSHMNNTSQGARAEWLELSDIDENILTEARKICIIMKREMGGIDFIPDSSSPFGYSCLEVNAIPQLTSGHDTLKKLDTLAAVIKRAESEDHS